MTFAEFLKTVFKSLNPERFRELATRSFKESRDYFISILFIFFCITTLLMVPTIASIPKIISGHIDQFSEFRADLKISTNEPVLTPEKNPFIIIDTTGKYTNLTREKLLVTQDTVYKKAGMCFWFDPVCWMYKPEHRTEAVPLSEFTDIIKQKENIATTITILLMFALPAFLIFLFFFLAAKYALIVLLMTGIVFLIAKFMMKKDIRYYRLLNIGMYSITIVMFLDLVLIPFKVNLFYIPLLVYLIMLIIGIYLIGHEDMMEEEVYNIKAKHHKSQHHEEKHKDDKYVELK